MCHARGDERAACAGESGNGAGRGRSSEALAARIRAGEKLHETMVPEDDARNAFEYEDCFVIRSLSGEVDGHLVLSSNGGRPCPEGFRYSSDNNSQWLTVPELQKLVNNIA